MANRSNLFENPERAAEILRGFPEYRPGFAVYLDERGFPTHELWALHKEWLRSGGQQTERLTQLETERRNLRLEYEQSLKSQSTMREPGE